MSNLIQINSFANKFSPNLLGIGSSFTDINQIYNITSGTGTLQAQLDEIFIEGNKIE